MFRLELEDLKKGDKVRIAYIDQGLRQQKRPADNPPYHIVGREVVIDRRESGWGDRFLVMFEGRRYRFRTHEFVHPEALWVAERDFGRNVDVHVERDYDNCPTKVTVSWACFQANLKQAETFARKVLSAVSYARRKNKQIARWRKEIQSARRGRRKAVAKRR